MLVYASIFPNTTSTQDDNVQIHAYTKDVWSMCLLGHIAGISLHIYSFLFPMTFSLRSKATMRMTPNQVLRGNECGWWCRLIFWYLYILLAVHKQMFVKASGFQLKIKGQYINNSGCVKPTLTLQTHEIEFLVLVILSNTTSPQCENVQIHAYSKDVRYMCLLGHIAGINLHIYGIERWKQHRFHVYNKFGMHTSNVWSCANQYTLN